jgi:glycosyltransferase involved in cell wall biosynthesis
MALGTLSAIMTNYNHAHFITRALTAILEQSHRPDELIVVDDGSTDNSVEIIESFVQRDPIVRLIRHERNRGLMQAIATGFEASRGDYLFFPAADDYVLPGHFEKSLRMLAEHPEAGLSFANFAVLDGATGRITQPRYADADAPAGYYSPWEMAARCSDVAPLTGHTALIRRTAFIEAGGCLPELQYACDWFNCWVVAFRHGACFDPETLTVTRYMPASYYHRCTRDRDRKREVLGSILRLLLSPAYADVLPFFQTGEKIHVHGTDLAHAARHDQLDENPDVIALVATLREDQLAGLLADEDTRVRQLGTRAAACRLMKQNGSLEAAIVALYGRQLELQVQVRTLQNQLSEVRNWTPLRLHRRVVPAVRRFAEQVVRATRGN